MQSLDLDRVFLLLSVAEKAANHGPKYQWIASAALNELNKLAAAHDGSEADGEE